ncbi:MAG: PaaI family thioesterase [Woeseia sp.]|nr:PaaI family thioesterase [Woeseia sp.]MBT8096572.1 PaaI family thioesterase [Woeseia sp.]NNE60224.1 PaaI family thioesterase [Woeseia sp.]NNL56070.1 PaaI family thioesterase [Woeseia sp.]
MTQPGKIEAATMCFACGPQNPIGLHIEFRLDSEGRCLGEFTPDANHVGYENTVHGGIIYAALDDVMANVMYLQQRKAHTARCEIRYRRPLAIGETILLSGWIEQERRRLLQMKGEARRGSDQELIADCEASFMLA